MLSLEEVDLCAIEEGHALTFDKEIIHTVYARQTYE
jgi:hypothetical protein